MSAMQARWIRLGPVGGEDLEAACAAIALLQHAGTQPIVLWAHARSDLRLPQCAAAPVAEPLRVEQGGNAMAVIVHRSRAPGREQRWLGWALSSVVAAYRTFKLPAYWDETASSTLVWMRGRPVAHGLAGSIGDCAVVSAGLDLGVLPQLPLRMSTPGALSDGVWRPLRPLCSRDFEDALRRKLEAQHGWCFEHAWLSADEKGRIAEMRAGVAA